MFAEILQLNQIYKTNEFTRVRARVLAAGVEDGVPREAHLVFVRDKVGGPAAKLGTNLTKLGRGTEEMGQWRAEGQALLIGEVLEYFGMDVEYEEREAKGRTGDPEASALASSVESDLLHECLRYSVLFFSYQALAVTREMFSKGSEEFSLHRAYTEKEEQGIREWVRRLYTSCILHQRRGQQANELEEEALRYRLEVLSDLNDHLKLHHALAGPRSCATADMILVCFLRRYMGFNTKDLRAKLDELTHGVVELPHLARYLGHLSQILSIGFVALDKKEQQLNSHAQQMCASPAFLDAVRAGNIEECEKILAVNPSAIRSRDGKKGQETAYHVAVQNKDYEMLRFLKKQRFCDFELADADGETALFEALYRRDLEMVRFLVEECQVNIEHREVQDRTPFYYACSVGQLEFARYLIKQGANVNALTAMGRTALTKAAWNGEHEMVQVLLEYPNVDLHVGDSQGRTALHMAAWGRFGGRLLKKSSKNGTDCPKSAELLLKRGADPNFQDHYKVTPLGTACGTGGASCVDLLVQHGANVNHTSADGVTALHECFYRGNSDCLDRLIRHAPDPTIREKTNSLPLHAAFWDDMAETLDYALNDKGFLETVGRTYSASPASLSALTISSDNIEDTMERIVAKNAEACFRVVLTFQGTHSDRVSLDLAKLLARIMTVFDDGSTPGSSVTGPIFRQVSEAVRHQLCSERADQAASLKVVLAMIVSRQTNGMDESCRSLFDTALDNLGQLPEYLLRMCVLFGKPECLRTLLQARQSKEREGTGLKADSQTESQSTTKEAIPQDLQDLFQPSECFKKNGQEIIKTIKSDAGGTSIIDLALKVDQKAGKGHQSCLSVLLEHPSAIQHSDCLLVDKKGNTLLHRMFLSQPYEVTTSRDVFNRVRDAIRASLDNDSSSPGSAADLEQAVDAEVKQFLQKRNEDGRTVMDLCQSLVASRRSASMAFLHLIKKWVVTEGNDEAQFDIVLIELDSKISDVQYAEMFSDTKGKQDNHLSRSKDLLSELQSDNKPIAFRKDFVSPYDLARPLNEQTKSLAETPFHWVDDGRTMEAALTLMRKELQKCPLLAVDLEYAHGDTTKQIGMQDRCVIVGLIQASTIDSDYIFDVFHLRQLIRADASEQNSLRAIFADQSITKIMHGCDSDLKYLVADLGIATVNLFDTAKVFSVIQRIPPLHKIQQDQQYQTQKHVDYQGLKTIVKAVLDVDMDKFFQQADWRIRPLPSGMLDYARSDSHYLIPVYLLFMKILHPLSFLNLGNKKIVDIGSFDVPEALRSMVQSGNNWYENIHDVLRHCQKDKKWDPFDKLLSLAELESLQLSIQKQFAKNNHYTMEVAITNLKELARHKKEAVAVADGGSEPTGPKVTEAKDPEAEKRAGKQLSKEEVKAQRELVKKQKAEKRANAKLKNEQKMADEAGEPMENTKKQKEGKKQQKNQKKEEGTKVGRPDAGKEKAQAAKQGQRAEQQKQRDAEQKKVKKAGQNTEHKDRIQAQATSQIDTQAKQKQPQRDAGRVLKSEKDKTIEQAIQLNQKKSSGNSSLILQGQFAASNFDNDMVKDMNPSSILYYLYNKLDAQTAEGVLDRKNKIYADMHPAVHDTGVKLLTGKLQSTNQKTVAILMAISEVITQFTPSKKSIDYHQELLSLIRDKIVPFLEQCSRFSPGTDYAIRHVRTQIGNMRQDCKSLEDLKEQIVDVIGTFIKVRVLYAQDTLISNGLNMLLENIEETILVYGNCESQTIEDLLKKAHDTKVKRFKVIVVDSAPDYSGRGLLKRLTAHGIKCQYTLIQMVNFLIQSVTKVFLPTSYIFCNGSLVAPVGSGMIACLAHKSHIPVVAISETYKFADRVNLDQINTNEQGSRHKFMDNFLRKNGKNSRHLEEIVHREATAGGQGPSRSQLELLNLKYDLTPQKYLSMIVCEVGNIPPHSVPVVIREIMHDIDEDEDDVLGEESSSGEDLQADGEEREMQERDGEESSGDEDQ